LKKGKEKKQTALSACWLWTKNTGQEQTHILNVFGVLVVSDEVHCFSAEIETEGEDPKEV